MMNKMYEQILKSQAAGLPFPETAKVALDVASQGIVLLKNNGVLPITEKKLAVFGVGAIDTITCGTGSGYAFSPYKVTVMQGLEKAGFEITTKTWYDEVYKDAQKVMEEQNKKLSELDRIWSGIVPEAYEPEISKDEIEKATDAKTAIYVIRRNTGENFDRKAERGDYYLSEREKENLELIAANFENTVVVLNTCVIDATEINAIEGVSAIVYLGQAGLETGNALADILSGNVNPSGKLTDTWAKTYSDYPASKTFSSNDGITIEEDYNEDIYVGYRYFDTFNIDVEYPFGYGLSYTTFEIKAKSVTANWQNITVIAEVKNTGKRSGREVVQVYCSAPNGKLKKPYQELRGFAKTCELQVGEMQELTITFPTETLSSYDEESAAWIMEKGDYVIRLGNHSRNTEIVGIIRLDETATTRQLSNQLSLNKKLELIEPKNIKEEFFGKPTTFLYAKDCQTVYNASKIKKEVVTYIPEGIDYVIPQRKYKFDFDLTERIEYVRNVPDATFIDVKEGRVTMEEFVASLDFETLLRIVTGTGKETPHPVPSRIKDREYKNTIPFAATGKMTSQYTASLGIPAMAMCDGPAGLHLMGSCCTGFPVGMVLAQTWDVDMANAVGNAYGLETEKYHVHVALGPGMNIHRDPLCGRNFEYYSEDPLITGKTAAAFTNGLQNNHLGYGVAPKHFACNNQELDRITMTSNVSERALREIYLKGFEICVRESHPKTIMSSYNCINGIHNSSRYDLLTDVLRGEWGFDGMVMTDWDSQSVKPLDLHAGNDIIMGGYNTDMIAAAITGKKPDFEADGAVCQKTELAYGGYFKNVIDSWNSFTPDKDGKDTVETVVPSGVELSPRVLEGVEKGIACVSENSDGTKTVTWKGTDKGAWLPLGDVQKCAIQVLKTILSSAPMTDMENESK